jgi:hypothetical protein
MRSVVYYIKETLQIEYLCVLFVGDIVNRWPRSIISLVCRIRQNMRQVAVTDSLYTPQLKSFGCPKDIYPCLDSPDSHSAYENLGDM